MKDCFIEKDFTTESYVMPLSHTHTYFEMYILQHGSRQVYIENNVYPMKENELIIIPPQILHRTEGQAYQKYCVNFNEDFLDEFQIKVIENCQRQKFKMTDEESKRIFYLTETMFNSQNKTYENSVEKNYFIKILFSYLIFEISHLQNFPSSKYTENKGFSRRTSAILKYIEKNYNTNITLDLLSKEFHYSKPALYNDFKKNTGLSIIDYVLKMRLNVAQNLLTNSKNTIEEIATLCGFSSPSYFYLIFKKYLKVSPSEYRKRKGNK